MAIKIQAASPRFFLRQMKDVYPKVPVAENKKSCHRKVSEMVLKRRNPNDIIWFFGGLPDNVAHSVLTDEHGKVLVGEGDGYLGVFHGEKGFQLPGDGNRSHHFLSKHSASEIL